MKKIDVCGLGNALVDLLFECSESEFNALGMKKGGMSLVDLAAQQQILTRLGTPVRMASGGSVANSVAMVGQLGGSGSLLCSVAQDTHGDFFKNDLAELGVDARGPSAQSESKADKATGTSLVVVTPDAERTMSTCLGASADLASKHLREDWIASSRWVFIEGYVVANTDDAREAITNLVAQAKNAQVKVAITLSDSFVVNGFRDYLSQILSSADLIFANENEAAALCGEHDVERAFNALRNQYKGVVVTAGPGGAYISYDGRVGHQPSFSCSPVDLTGAGDAFAGAFLHSLCGDDNPLEAARKGCFYASKVIRQWGARLRGDMPNFEREYSALPR